MKHGHEGGRLVDWKKSSTINIRNSRLMKSETPFLYFIVHNNFHIILNNYSANIYCLFQCTNSVHVFPQDGKRARCERKECHIFMPLSLSHRPRCSIFSF